jgi:hypothetical protein
MATSTIVFTYTVGAAEGTGEKSAVVDSFTVDGTAYASLDAAEVTEAVVCFKQGLVAVIRDGKQPTGGWGARDLTS